MQSSPRKGYTNPMMQRRVNPQLPTHDGRRFQWDGGVGYAEASDLTPQFFGRVYSDAADAGFYVRSHKTGVKKLFIAAGARRISGDVVSWLFKSPDGFVVEIFND